MSLIVPEKAISFLYETEFKNKLSRLREVSTARNSDKYAKFVQRRRNFTLDKQRQQLKAKPYWQTVVELYEPTDTGGRELQRQRNKLATMIEARIK